MVRKDPSWCPSDGSGFSRTFTSSSGQSGPEVERENPASIKSSSASTPQLRHLLLPSQATLNWREPYPPTIIANPPPQRLAPLQSPRLFLGAGPLLSFGPPSLVRFPFCFYFPLHFEDIGMGMLGYLAVSGSLLPSSWTLFWVSYDGFRFSRVW